MTGRSKRAWSLTLQPATMRTLAFLTGLGLTIKEAWSHGPERPSLYVLYGGMITGSLVWGQGATWVRKRDADEDE